MIIFLETVCDDTQQGSKSLLYLIPLLSKFTAVAKIYFIVQIFLPLALACVKVSLLTFYLRLSPSTTFRLLLFGSMLFVGCSTIASLFLWTFSCTPIYAHWNLDMIPEYYQHCTHIASIQYSNIGINMITDMWVWALPLPMILKMKKIPGREKLVVLAIMSGGFVACLASIGRLVSTWNASRGENLTSTAAFAFSSLITFATVEMCLGITVSCVPALRPLLEKSFPQVFKSVISRSPGISRDFPTIDYKFDNDHNDSRKLDSSASSNDTISLGAIVLKGNEKPLPRSILKGSSSNSTMNSTTFTDTMQDIDIEAADSSQTMTTTTTTTTRIPTTTQSSNLLTPMTAGSDSVSSKNKHTVTIIAPPRQRPRLGSRQGSSLWDSFQSTISRKLSIDRENVRHDDKEGEGDLEPMQRVNETNEQHDEEDWNLSVNDFCIDPNLEHAVPYDVFNESDIEGDIARVRKREVNPLILFLREEGKKSAAKNRMSMGHKYPLPGDIEGDDFDEIREIDEDEDVDVQEMASSAVQHLDSHGESYADREVWRGDRMST